MFRSALAAALILGAPALAQDDHDHAGHEHGAATLNAMIGGSDMRLTLRMAGSDLFGHTEEEHTEEHDSHSADHDIEDARGYFETPADFVTFPAAAGCEMSSLQVLMDEIEGGEHDGHRDFEATYFFTCSDPAALTELTVTAFGRENTELEEVDASVVANGVAESAELTADAPTMTFGG